MGKMGNRKPRLRFRQESPGTSEDSPRSPHVRTEMIAGPSPSHATPFRKLISANGSPNLG